MIDPERLLDTDLQDATSLRERELLGSLKPSATTRAAVWGRIVGQGVLVAGATAAATTAAATTAAATTATATTATVGVSAAAVEAAAAGASTAVGVTTTTGVMSSLAAKAGVALLVAAPVLGTTVYLTRGVAEREQSAAVVPASVAPGRTVHSAAAEPSAQGTSLERAEVAAVAVSEPKQEASSAPSASNADALREENRLLREARSLERAGDPGRALRILNELDRLFARGALLQEREILRIQALSASGSRSAAKVRAEQFLKRYPASPYAAHVRSILDSP